ncbi:ABC transporter ATP-binding protein, partial [Streptomyces sp. SID625]|nr:ABC transporter ATP-binding protein [Streptomyces sp. SID625]
MTSDAAAPDAVTCTRLTYTFGGTHAVDGLDLAVRPGEVFGLLGPNG